MILSNLNKNIFILFLFLLFPKLLQAEESIDIWKKNKKAGSNIEKKEIRNETSNIYQSNINKNKNSSFKIQEDNFEKFEETKLYGLFDPDENNFSINMWSNTNAVDFKNIINRINKLQLSPTAEDIFIKTIFSNSFKPQNIKEQEFANIKINWLIKNKKDDLIENFLEQNGEFHNKSKLIQYLVDKNLSKANIPNACKKISFIDIKIKDPYLEKFKIYCLIFNGKRSEALLNYDILKEQNLSDNFFDNKINFLLGLKEKDNGKTNDDNLMNFYLSSITVENFKYEPNDKTKTFIWDYLNASNLIKIENIEDKQKISDLETAANANKLEKIKILEIYKQIPFDINTLINANTIYQNLSNLDARALIYQRYLLAENVENQLEYLFLLKDLFKKDKLSNIYSKFLSDKLEELNEDQIPKKYKEIVKKNIIQEKELQLGKVKYDDKILHQSKVLKYFVENNYPRSKVEKDLKSVYKKIKKNKNYFFSAKDLAVVESLADDGVKVMDDLNYKKIAEKYTVPNNLIDLAKKNQKGYLALKIVEIIGEDDVKNLDSETIYFITNLLNQVDLLKIRNSIIASALPLRV